MPIKDISEDNLPQLAEKDPKKDDNSSSSFYIHHLLYGKRSVANAFSCSIRRLISSSY